MVGAQLQHGLGAVEQQTQPHRAVVQQLSGHDVGSLDTQRCCNLGQQRRTRYSALEGWCGKSKPLAAARAFMANLHQALLAFLNDKFATFWRAPGLQPAVAATQRRVTCKRQLTARCEDTDAVVRQKVRGRQ